MRGLNDINGETRIADGAQKGVELEIADELGSRWRDVGRVKVVEDVGYFANGYPVVTFVCNETLLLGHVLVRAHG